MKPLDKENWVLCPACNSKTRIKIRDDTVLENFPLYWYIGRNLTAVSAANAKTGDFALYPDSSHIGVVVGRNEAGKLLICHCASGQNNIVITEFSASGFTAVGKLSFMD